MTNRFAISCPQLNLKGDQTTIDQTSDIPQAGGIERKPARRRGHHSHPAIRTARATILESVLPG
jgi:hypothetical protein